MSVFEYVALDEKGRRRKGFVDAPGIAAAQWYKQVTGMADVTIPPELITVRSNYFKIISVGKMKNMSQGLSGVVKRSGQTVQIIKWRPD
jgi:hypothetical protein